MKEAREEGRKEREKEIKDHGVTTTYTCFRRRVPL